MLLLFFGLGNILISGAYVLIGKAMVDAAPRDVPETDLVTSASLLMFQLISG